MAVPINQNTRRAPCWGIRLLYLTQLYISAKRCRVKILARMNPGQVESAAISPWMSSLSVESVSAKAAGKLFLL